MAKEYKTVLHSAVAEIEEKKSRFIASVIPVASEEEALNFINGLKTKYWDATHNVYCYHIGGTNAVQRFSDDGEPSGTAGMPVLEVMKRMEVRDLAVVVTRYFGGTLLGAAGLVRAYSRSAASGIEAAVIVKRLLCTEARVVVEYTLFGRVQSLLMSKGYTIKNIIYEQDVDIIVYVTTGDEDEFTVMLEEATNARAVVEFGGKCYITVGEDGKLII